MNIEYKRSMGQSYMVIEPDVMYKGYEEQMLKQNDLKCLLTFYSTNSNGVDQLWYDISKMRALRDVVEQEGLSRDLLTKLMTQLEHAYAQIKSYLISDDHLYLTPDTIYLDTRGEDFSMYLCYLPADDGMQEIGLEMLFEYFIQTVDHEDDELREMCYEMYDGVMSQRESIISIAEKLRGSESAKSNTEEETGCAEIAAEPDGILRDEEDEDYEVALEPDEYSNPKKKSIREMLFKKKKNEEEPVQYKPTLRMKWKAKWDRLFPKRERKETYEDFEEEADEVYEPTRLLTESYCQGILKYQGEGPGSDFLIRKNHFSVGNLKGSDAYIQNETVSKHHARILKGEGGEYYLEDLNSTNGTFVNGKMLPYKQQYRLQAGDEVCFANAKYQFY